MLTERCIGILLAALLVTGCTAPPTQPDFNSPVPAAKIAAIRAAARTNDATAIPDLVTQLGSGDPVVRLMAIETLRDLTGETYGYRYDDPPATRRAAIQRWVDAVKTRKTASKTLQSNQNVTAPEQSANSSAKPDE